LEFINEKYTNSLLTNKYRKSMWSMVVQVR
jgi:hypothetical protein